MEKPPVRMECYDISNIQGTDNVASMVVMINGKAARDQYRRFRIKSFEGANDFEAMHEVLGRRFRHGLEEIEERKREGLPLEQGRFSWMPDLIVIDGGPIQLEFARKAMLESGVDLPMVSLAKREEEIYLPDREDPVVLPHSTPALQMMQRIRDESHRFAITYHRSLRGHRMLASFLDEIPGVGPARRKALLKAFLSREQMKQATCEELADVPGIPADVARRVYDALHEKEDDA
jgi:excinuclease ABC subunit C